MHVAIQTNKLTALIRSFFVKSRKQFMHYMDCEIYSQRHFCNCGLLYRLNHLDLPLASIIYPAFEDELYLQDTGKKRKKRLTNEQIESIKILEEVFGPLQKPSFEDLKAYYEDMSKILNTCFTKKMFPSAFRRLNKWLQKEVSREN